MNDWTVYFSHRNIDDAIASCTAQTVSRGVHFMLATEPSLEKEDLNIRATARHEVCHALIAEVSHMVGEHSTEEEWKKADEQLVCRLTNLLDDEK